MTMMRQRGPAGMVGRVSAAFRTLSIAGTPLGTPLGGVMAAAWGLNTPALGAAVLFVRGLTALVPRMRTAIN
ncbi:hypothetical protein ABZU86_17415 [Streptomyces sp. NPDC005271]|uniref:hypothetical protein n=1 Tax=unclassified Streptomyces TaxID=2593676 RepID=UPI00339F1E2D